MQSSVLNPRRMAVILALVIAAAPAVSMAQNAAGQKPAAPAAPAAPASTTQRHPSSPSGVLPTRSHASKATVGTELNCTVWLKANARPRICFGTSSEMYVAMVTTCVTSSMFLTALAPNLLALDILENEPALIDKLWDNTRFFKKGLETLGFNTGISESPVTPVIAGEGAQAMKLSDRLFQEGVFAQGIAFPTVARDKARVRTIVTAAHTREELQFALDVFAKVGRELGLI